MSTTIYAHEYDWHTVGKFYDTWDLARNSDPRSIYTDTEEMYAAIQHGTGTNFNIIRSGLVLDTDELGAGFSVTSAKLYVWCYDDYEGTGELVITDSNSISLPADTNSYHAMLSNMTVVKRVSYADINVADWTEITIPADKLSVIQTTDLTHLGLWYSADYDNDESAAPSSDNSYGGRFHTYEEDTHKAYIVLNYTGTPGYIWVEGTKLHYIDAASDERSFEGTDTTANGTAGHLWVEGTYLHYIDQNGDERRQEGTKEGATGATAGHIWIELTKIRYIDSSGDERYIEGS